MLGYGLAGALSPYLGVVPRDIDARLPFVMSSVVLLITTFALSRVERDLADDAAPTRRPAAPPKAFGTVPIIFIAAMVLLALGYQLHFAINSGPLYLRFAKPMDLRWLAPVFWIGFNVAMFSASLIVKHRGGLIVMGAAGLLGAGAVLVAEVAGGLNTEIAAQFIAGAAWGCMLMSAVSAALAIGHTGAEGKVAGLVFSALALARDLCAHGGGCGRLAEAARLRAAVALGAGGVLVGGRRGAVGDCGGEAAAERTDVVPHAEERRQPRLEG
ncbi:MAG TPA: hypothetical protein VHS76_15935 [Steroidobacteraceae bacterium]|jgi:hypothetical protein|nr:hypothetical protein [Steroidobacteraceae bacterium]